MAYSTIPILPRIKKEHIPLLRRGFRPFFLLASVYGAFFLSAWMALFLGTGFVPAVLDPVVWHAHEMVFGFAAAAVSGFLLTATATWTQHPPVQGARLGLVIGVWAAGRVAMWLSGVLPAYAVAAADLALFPVLGYVLAPVLFARGNRIHLLYYVVFGLFFTANLLIHLEPLRGIKGAGQPGLWLGVGLLALLIVIVIGRIVPTFCDIERMTTGGSKTPASRPSLEAAAIISVTLLLAANLLDREAAWVGLLALAAAAIQIVRMAHWRAGRLLRKPYIAALHLGYAWVIAGLACLGIAYLDGPVPEVSALHAITVGGIGTTILAVMSIVGLLHTGRPAKIHPMVILSYLLLTAAALLRTAAPIIFYETYRETLLISGGLWAAAFVIYAVIYWPILTRGRPDGIPE
jgi:uncharacterized protein involved in response to NO